ncbi:MAG: ROK family protein [Nanoarchaeota archaeon]
MASKKSEHAVIAADIGGTNCRLSICTRDAKGIRIHSSKIMDTQRVRSITPNLLSLRDSAAKDGMKIQSVCIAAAGVVKNGVVRRSQNNLVIDEVDVSKALGIDRVTVVNDFTAYAASLDLIDYKDPRWVVPLTANSTHKTAAKKLVVGFGTGIGQGLRIPSAGGRRWTYIPSELGHAGLTIQNATDRSLHEYIKKTTKQDAEFEHLCSGSGIVLLYEYHNEGKQTSAFRAYVRTPDEHRAAFITTNRGKDKACRSAVNEFVRQCARYIRVASLAFLPEEIYIAGGIAPKLVDEFKQAMFMRTFIEGPYVRSREDVPIFLLTKSDLGILGSAHIATTMP